MEGWVDLGYPAIHRLGVKLVISHHKCDALSPHYWATHVSVLGFIHFLIKLLIYFLFSFNTCRRFASDFSFRLSNFLSFGISYCNIYVIHPVPRRVPAGSMVSTMGRWAGVGWLGPAWAMHSYAQSTLITVSKRTFAVSSTNLWNKLPTYITSAPSLLVFRQCSSLHLARSLLFFCHWLRPSVHLSVSLTQTHRAISWPPVFHDKNYKSCSSIFDLGPLTPKIYSLKFAQNRL